MADLRGIEDLLDHPVAPGNTTPAPRTEPVRSPSRRPMRRVQLSVVWGDLAKVPADVHMAGHYQGVLPAQAERALDEVISGRTSRCIITEHTRRGWVSGRLGEVVYFPSVDGVVHLAAVAGLGRHGTFNERRAVQLYTSLFTELALLPGVSRAASVLIGAGTGNLSVDQAIGALVDGFADALARWTEPPPLRELVLVEIDRLRAEQLLASLHHRMGVRGDVGLDVLDGVHTEQGGTVSAQAAAAYSVLAVAKLVASREQLTGESNAGRPVGAAAGDPTVLAGIDEGIRGLVCDQLTAFAGLPVGEVHRLTHEDGASSSSPGAAADGSGSADKPVRMSVLSGQDHLKWAALADYASVPERQVPRTRLFDELVKRLHDPSTRDADRLPQWLTRMVIPQDFHAVVTDQAPLVLELDRGTAPLHWEFMADLTRDDGDQLPLALRTPIARQLRTGYSRVLIDPIVQTNLRALVVGDPGKDGAALKGARNEARHVVEALTGLGVEVVAYIGAPSGERDADLADTPPATRLEVLGELLSGRFDLVHYCGHGTLDETDPQRAGWVFSEGLITALELSQLAEAPRIVVANACYSSVVSGQEDSTGARLPMTDPGLTPGLADEFLRAGVLHYIGTAWQIHDAAGAAFATTFYRSLLGEGASLGAALCAARRTVHEQRERWGTTWAAYQHYGDPGDYLKTNAATPGPGV